MAGFVRMHYTCPVCGFPDLDEPPRTEGSGGLTRSVLLVVLNLVSLMTPLGLPTNNGENGGSRKGGHGIALVLNRLLVGIRRSSDGNSSSRERGQRR
jgi:hypothetical protein